MKVAVVLTLLRFKLEVDPSKFPNPTVTVTLKSENGIHLHLKKLQKPWCDKERL